MYRLDSKGFTLFELIVVMMVSSFLLISLFGFTSRSINSFMKMQAEGLARSKLADGVFRVSQVLRSSNFVEEANADSFTAYAYFAPQDLYTSKIRYYLSPSQDQLLADVTPMTADYPVGTLLTGQQRTVVVIDKFYKRTSYPTFQYFTSTNTELSAPVSNMDSIDNITVNLYTKVYQATDEYKSSTLTVNMRNRKSNL